MRPLTSNEAERLKRLRGLGLLDTTPEPHFDSVCRLAMAVFSAPIAIVSLADEDRLRFKACIGTGLREVSREVGLCNHPIESGEPLIVGDALADARFADNPLVTGEPHARFYAGIPLTLHADVCVGALCVIDTKPRQVCEEHARQLRDLAELVVAHLRLRERTAQYETERSLRTTTLESMDQGLIMVDADGIVQVHNSRAQELLGLPPDLLRSNPSFEDVRRHQVASGDFSPAAMASFPFLMRAGLDASLPCYERERPNGTVLEVRTVRLADGGAVRTYTDVTARKRAETAMAESQARLSALADTLPQKVWVTDLDGTATYQNAKVYDYYGPLGLDREDRLALLHPDDRDRFRNGRQRAMDAGERFETEARMRRKDGVYRWHRITLAPIHHQGAIAEWAGTALDIHDTRQAQEDLQKTTDLLRLAQEGAAAGYWDWDMVANRCRLSPESVRVHNLPEGHPGEVTTDEWAALVHPADLPKVWAEVERAVATRSTFSAEFRIPERDGEVRWLHGLGRVIFGQDGTPIRLVGLNIDVTGRKRAEEALRVSEERLALALDAAEDGIFDWNLETGAVFRSERWATMLGYEASEVGRDLGGWEALVHPEDQARTIGRLNDHLEGRTPAYESEHRLRRKDGSWAWIKGKGKVVARDEHGRNLRMVGTISDITAHKHAECALTEAKAAAERANEAKTEFLASMSHEIRTPLHGILGYTERLLDDDRLSSDQRRSLERIQSAGSALLTVVNDVLDFSRVEAGEIELETRCFVPADLVDDAFSMVRSLADQKGLKTHVEVARDFPHCVVGDQNRLRQVLINLLNNAVKFTPKGEIALRVLCSARSATASTLRFEVSDTGIGIPKERRDRLFQRFSQVDSSIRREFGGTGLGLAISRRLVEQMGGGIGFESLEGRGSTFWFEVNLPVAPMDDRTLVEKPADLQPRSRGRILLVEDNEINQEIARAVLQAAGHEVDVASDGIEAVAAVQAKTYDLVLMDVQMPGMDGITATKTIRVLPHAARDLPILAMTANVLPQQVEEFRAAGMDDHVGKPFRRDELHVAIHRWLGRRSAHPALQGSRKSTSRGEGDATCPPERAPSEAS